MYMAFLGGTGLRELAALNRDKSEYLKRELLQAGCQVPFDTTTFNEFVVRFPDGAEKTCQRLLEKKIVAGLPLGPYYPELADYALVCTTETSRKSDIDALVKEVTS
jgi:glycine dehydrogenase subunit 1